MLPQEFRNKVEETAQPKLRSLTRKQLDDYYYYFSTSYQALGDSHPDARQMARIASQQMALLRAEIDDRVARKILCWAIVGGIAAAVGTLVLLFHDTPLSKLLPATTSQLAPTPSPTATVTASTVTP